MSGGYCPPRDNYPWEDFVEGGWGNCVCEGLCSRGKLFRGNCLEGKNLGDNCPWGGEPLEATVCGVVVQGGIFQR